MNPEHPADPHTQMALQVVRQLRLLYGSVKHYFREVEEACGLSGSHLWVLQEIGRTPGIGVSDLAERMSIHQSTCSLLVEKLEARRLVEKRRLKDDQRRVGLHLSAEGRRVLEGAPGPDEGLLPEALVALPDSALRALHGSLSELVRNLRARDDRLADKPLSD
ncbi:MAG: MarR family winged helix-turn-helix transcriptional regulator [Candidatus Nitricoxidivorans perseverans]|uniref:MarR family winged helix-turn-helix transcriptional regulator n=1 Tax=Candidatus Nitricoxidivorans perseverans TaxID=2975601 RepID=A0AA49FK89_9PROT|nr:MAG: MarR family winged helix-turn-helix transcriptional regulator [Candidatus Nitricoxidivorans perseverans]